jgi:hypothetical protein
MRHLATQKIWTADKPPRDSLRPDQPGRSQMRRREFIAGLGSATAWSMVAQAQQATMPVIGSSTPNPQMTTGHLEQ